LTHQMLGLRQGYARFLQMKHPIVLYRIAAIAYGQKEVVPVNLLSGDSS
jgi:hypothetical protein